MAGTATHLAIADRICELIGNRITNPALFFSGNIAPDAIHAKPGYQRSDKKRTHLTENISGGDFQNPEKLSLFHSRVNSFIDDYYHPEDESSDLYLGYIIHLITDELFNIHVRKQLSKCMERDGIKEEDPLFFKRIIGDIESVDHVVVKEYPFKKDPRQLLNSVWDYEIKDYISSAEINNSKWWIVNTFLSGKDAESAAVYYDYNTAYKFIIFAADNIIDRLTNGIDYRPILQEIT